MKDSFIKLVNLPWIISFQKERSDEVLKMNLNEVYKIISKDNIFDSSSSLLMIIVWNMISDKWSSNISFLATDEHLSKILHYLLLEKLDIIPGITTTIFTSNPNPKFIITFEKGEKFKFITDDFEDVKCYHFILSKKTENVYKVLSAQLKKIDNRFDNSAKKVKEFVNITFTSTNNQININSYNTDSIITEIKNKKNFSNIFESIDYEIKDELIKAIGEIIPLREELDLEKSIVNLYKSIINISGYIQSNQILKYYFNSSGAQPENQKQFGKFVQKDGGVIVVVEQKKNCKEQVFGRKDKDLDMFITSNIIFSKSSTAQRAFLKYLMDQTSLKTAIISILIDSFAHNISAHSLAALKWWIELRHKMMDKRFYVDDSKGLTLKGLQPKEIKITQEMLKDTTEKYYETLGQIDSKYNKEFFSLYDYLQFAPLKELINIFSFSDSDYKQCSEENKGKVSNIAPNKDSVPKCFSPRFPVPLDYALFPFFRFLRDKGAFWSGVTRDMAFGGETKTWYKILWEDFANNPLYIGTIAKSEGITKININLAIKKDGKWVKGRFVTIDMSVIEYEEKLALDSNLQPDEALLNTETKKDDCAFSSNCSVEYSKYSKYALIKLGGCFKSFREELSKDEYSVFLPGGVIGEHALFTIFENTLRNIKHYKELSIIKKNGIDFWISLEKVELKINEQEIRPNDKPFELFKTSVWLEHKTELYKDNDAKEQLKECLWKKVTDASLKPILDDNGSPRMGGNSQDKACAAMLFNNKFISVESKDEKRDKNYYPWVHFTSTISENHYVSEFDNPKNKDENLNYYYDDESKRDTFVKQYIKSLKNEKNGFLKKYFYLWKSEDYFIIKDQSYLKGENVARFKFVLIPDSIEDPKKRKSIMQSVREDGIIRLLFSKNDFKADDLIKLLDKTIPGNYETDGKRLKKIKNERLKNLYNIWLKDWLKYDKHYSIGFKKDRSIKAMITINEGNKVTYLANPTHNELMKNTPDLILKLSHGGDDEDSSCNVRSHGVFWNRYFINSTDKSPEDLEKPEVYDKKKEYLLMEFVEIVATKIFIFDNRLKLRIASVKEKKREDVFERMLGIYVKDEKLGEKEKYFSEQLNNVINNDEELKENKSFPMILVIHLSYIEALGYKEDDITTFIEEQLKDFIDDKDNFILVLTSGRGRDAWRNNLDTKYKMKTIFKPVESLISAVENGISYNDNFDVKYNLIKVIFGS